MSEASAAWVLWSFAKSPKRSDASRRSCCKSLSRQGFGGDLTAMRINAKRMLARFDWFTSGDQEHLRQPIQLVLRRAPVRHVAVEQGVKARAVVVLRQMTELMK